MNALGQHDTAPANAYSPYLLGIGREEAQNPTRRPPFSCGVDRSAVINSTHSSRRSRKRRRWRPSGRRRAGDGGCGRKAARTRRRNATTPQAVTSPHSGYHRCQQYYYFALGISSCLWVCPSLDWQTSTTCARLAMRLVACLYDVFDADLGERRSNGRSSSVRPSSVPRQSQRRFLSVHGSALQKRVSTQIGQLPKN
jgi:hypothetical protein